MLKNVLETADIVREGIRQLTVCGYRTGFITALTFPSPEGWELA